MFSQFTPQKKITVPYRLNKDKQLLRLQKSLNSASDLSMDQFKFSRMRLSATVKNVHPFVFKTLGNVASKFCGMSPKCAEHGTLPFTFKAQENWDDGEPAALVTFIVTVNQQVGNCRKKVGEITLHYTTRTLQVSSRIEDNVVVLLEYVMAPLIKLTNMCGSIDSNIKCIDCASQSAITGPTPTIDNSRPITSDESLSLEVSSPLLSPSNQCNMIIPTMRVIPFNNVVSRPITLPFPIFNYRFSGFNSPPYGDQPTTPKVTELSTLPQLARNKHPPKLQSTSKLTELPSTPQVPRKERPPRVLSTAKIHDPNPTLSPEISANEQIKEITRLSNRLNSLESEVTDSKSRIHSLEIINSELATENAALKTEIKDLSKMIEDLSKSLTELNTKKSHTCDCSKNLGQVERKLQLEVNNLKNLVHSSATSQDCTTKVVEGMTSVISLFINKLNELNVQPSPSARSASDDSTVAQPATSSTLGYMSSVNSTSISPQSINPPASPSTLGYMSRVDTSTTGSQTNVSQSRQPRSPSRKPPPPPRQIVQPRPLDFMHQPPPPSTSGNDHRTNIKMFGASNTNRISKGLQNVIPDMVIEAKSGATFEQMASAIALSGPCDIIVIAGGVNESLKLRNLELARAPLQEAIRLANIKSRKVIVMPPPPLTHQRLRGNIKRMTDIMRYEASRANVEFIEASSYFTDDRLNGVDLFDRSGLHGNRLGSGIYAFSLLHHLSNHHPHLRVDSSSFCVNCHLTGHTFNTCRDPDHPQYAASQHGRYTSQSTFHHDASTWHHPSRVSRHAHTEPPFNVTTYNRYDSLSNFDSYYD